MYYLGTEHYLRPNEDAHRAARWHPFSVDENDSPGLAGRRYPVLRPPDAGPYSCPCCGYVTLAERGGFEICPVCFWEDDGQDDPDADLVMGGPNGGLSLTQARRNFAAYGACDERCRAFVRPPMPMERRAV